MEDGGCFDDFVMSLRFLNGCTTTFYCYELMFDVKSYPTVHEIYRNRYYALIAPGQ